MTEYTVPDCLVLKLEEVDINSKEIDTVVFILYDAKKSEYVIRGQRTRTLTYDSCTYSFISNSIPDVVNFLQYVICKSNLVNETLYNYDNLSNNSNNITFEFLQEYEDKEYELSGYNNLKLSKKRLVRNLNILRNVFNYYN